MTVARLDDHGFVEFLGSHDRHIAAEAQAVLDHVVGEDVELLLTLAVDVLRAEIAENIDQPGPANLGLNDLGGQGDAGEQPTELPGRGRMPGLLFDQVLLDGDVAIRGLHNNRFLGMGVILGHRHLRGAKWTFADPASHWHPRSR